VELADRDHYSLLDSAKRFENFEVGYGARIGLGQALKYLNEIGPSNVEARVLYLGEYCRRMISSIPRVTLQDTGTLKGGIVMFSVEGRSPVEVREFLHQHQINVWASSGPGSLVDFQQRGIDCLVRASLHYFNTEQEIDKMAGLLESLPVVN
ncbi:MAG: aminotransferase class V-fold PLP-dependent enzyme, partial [bacterium]